MKFLPLLVILFVGVHQALAGGDTSPSDPCIEERIIIIINVLKKSYEKKMSEAQQMWDLLQSTGDQTYSELYAIFVAQANEIKEALKLAEDYATSEGEKSFSTFCELVKDYVDCSQVGFSVTEH